MKTITLVTGNAGKLAEWQRLFLPKFELVSKDIDLDEIQTLDMEALINDKVRRAYEVVGGPVIVEDIAAGLDSLGGLPGPFIKFFEQTLGRGDALFQLAKKDREPATVRCAAAYYDGEQMLTVHATVKGVAVSAKGNNGFGFDCCFIPEGSTKTYGEMIPAEKDMLSHRSKAVKLLVDKLLDTL